MHQLHMKFSSKLLIFLLFCVSSVISIQAQHTIGEASILFVGETPDEDGNSPVYLMDIYSDSEPVTVGYVNGQGSDVGWSPDGRYVHTVHFVDEDTRALTLYEVDTDTTTEIVQSSEGSHCYSLVQWSTDGRFMAYQYGVDDHIEFVIRDTTNDSEQVLELEENRGISWGYWSPSGRYVAIPITPPTQASDIRIYDAVMQQEVMVIDDIFAYGILWGHDESYFVFHQGSTHPITRYDTTTSEFSTDLSESWGALSPNALCTYCFSLSYGGYSAALYSYEFPADTDIVVPQEFGDGFRSYWSPDGRYLTLGLREESGQSLYVLDTQTGVLEEVVSEKLGIHHIDWSPTSEYLAVAYSLEATEEMHPRTVYLTLYNPTTKTITNYDYAFREGYYSSALSWTADGRYLRFADNEKGIVHLDVAENTELDIFEVTGISGNGWLWSTDGRYLLFRHRNEDETFTRYAYDSHEEIAIPLPQLPADSTIVGWRGAESNVNYHYCGMG